MIMRGKRSNIGVWIGFFLIMGIMALVIDMIDHKNTLERIDDGPATKVFYYMLDGEKHMIDFTLYNGLNEYLAEQPRELSYSEGDTPPDSKDFVEMNIDNEYQMMYLKDVAKKIHNIEINNRDLSDDDKARVAISLVQMIPYDSVAADTNTLTSKYAYEVLFTQKGVCGEKAELLMFLLRELGYGVAYMEFYSDDHAAAGIKCPPKYSYLDSGYCFIETTEPTIITDSEIEYESVGALTTRPFIYTFPNTKSFDSVEEEYNDAQRLNTIDKIADGSGGLLEDSMYGEWENLVQEYGLLVDT
jgi:hypothetical protein